MKTLFLISLALGAFTRLSAQAVVLSVEEFEKGLAVPHTQLLDVRRSSEFNNGHIKNSLQADWTNFDQFKDRVQYLDKNKPVLVYCAAGPRSSAAAQWLRQNGYKDVQELKGGITAWRLASKPVAELVAVKQMDLAEYTQLSKGHKTVLVDFGAEWCPPCKKMEPVLKQLQNDLKSNFKLVNVDAGIHVDVMKKLSIEAIPTFVIYKNGKETWRSKGVTDISELKKHLGN